MKMWTAIAVVGIALVTGISVYANIPGKVAMSTGNDTSQTGRGEDHDASGHREGGHQNENSVEMSDAKVAASGIEILSAQQATLHDSIILNGILQPNQETLVQVTPRFSGVVREIKKRIGDVVEKGDLLAKIESNQSLTVYELRAPISGTVIDRQVALGEYASEQKPAFIVADVSTVWVDLSVYRRDLPRVRVGDKLLIDVGDGGKPIDADVSYISPVGSSDTQTALARAVIRNEGMRLRTGLFVSARLILSARQVPVAVKTSAIQTIENRSVVFVRLGDRFEIRDVSLGSRDSEHVEVMSGIRDGDKYAAGNSFVVKAEIAKGTATHEH
ncbi:MAG: divalent metal ion exporter adaptor subunit IhpB [Xanthobacteraceae bacterium]